MTVSQEAIATECTVRGPEPAAEPEHEAADLLERAFGISFTLIDGTSGEPVRVSAEHPECDWSVLAEICRVAALRGRPEFIAEEPPFALFAVPLPSPHDHRDVAVAPFLTRSIALTDNLRQAAEALGMEPEQTVHWAARQIVWPPEVLERVADVLVETIDSTRCAAAARQEARSLSAELASTYEEISLLYRLTQNLRISQSDEDLGRIALDWLAEVIPAEGFAIQYLPLAEEGQSANYDTRTTSKLIAHGRCPVTDEEFSRFVDYMELQPSNWPVIFNRPATENAAWPLKSVRQMIAVPLAEGENLFGWLLAFNHVDDEAFGSIEASLMSSVGAILGIHSGNIELYHQQSELLASVVRVLTSAIDAKDPYTCGHSDRVAQVAVRLAQELGCDADTLNTIYLSGLLHDIGKIGINDNVLRKPGKLSDQEYEHIKTHVRIGHKILHELRKLDGVLPVVLHHHEAWDGRGYPDRLPAEHIPLSARIVAVADAFDAMGSDRPYRKGMPDEKIDEIFRSGAGRQWDPAIVDAFFRAREDIRAIVRGVHDTSRANVSPAK